MFKSFRKSEAGNMAIMMALGVSVLLVGIGAAVDISGTANSRQSLQDMIDNATLAAAKSKSRKRKDLKIIVDKVIAQHNRENWNIKAKVTLKDDVVHVSATTKYDTMIMGIFGRDKINLLAEAASPIAQDTPVNVTLVLDTTGSMAGDNIRDLKVAAKDMIEEFEKFDSKVRMAVVPFGQYVNVGTKRRNATWVDTSKDGTFDEYEHCYDEQRTIKARVCTGTGVMRSRDNYSDGRFTGTSTWEEQSCEPGVYEPTGNRICEMRRTDYTWYGCVGSRENPYNEQAPYASRRIPGIMNVTCGSVMEPLTSNLSKVEDVIDDLTTSGETYLPAGIMWGWRSLQKDLPFTQVKNADKKNATNAMVIMTDGENTLSQGSDGRHDARDTDAANTRTAALCKKAKEDNIQIFTVGYRMGSGREDMETLLKGCATTKGQYYDAGNAAELKKAFKDIANSLDFTRLSM